MGGLGVKGQLGKPLRDLWGAGRGAQEAAEGIWGQAYRQTPGALNKREVRETPTGEAPPYVRCSSGGAAGRARPAFPFPTPGTSWGLSGEERPVLLPPGPSRVSAWPGLEVSLGRAEAGSSGGDFFLGGEQRLQAGSGRSAPAPRPISAFSPYGSEFGLRSSEWCLAATFEIFSPRTSRRDVFFLRQTTPWTWLQNSLSKRTRETRRGTKVSRQAAGGFLGSVVFFAVGFIAQNTINLVDNGRRQFRKDLYGSNVLHELVCAGSTQEHGADPLVPQAPGYG